jgi:benzoate/toluate 1,2-dioxygenase subunit alpha
MNDSFDVDQLVRSEEVHARVYTDPAIFERELELVFGRTWIFIGHESEVANSGDFKTDRIGRWPILMTRDAGGAVRVFYNICRHRGATLCHESGGNARSFKCMYHGWAFGSDGALIGVPLRERMQDFEQAEYGLRPLARVESYRGFVFANLSPDGMPLRTYLASVLPYLDEMVERAPNRRISAVKPIRYEFDGNWKLQIENFSENYHPSVLHQSVFALRAKHTGKPTTTMKESANGSREMTLAFGHAVVDFLGSRRGRPNPGDEAYVETLTQRDGAERAVQLRDRDLHILIYPNLLLHTRFNHYRVVKPLAVNRTEIDVYPCMLDGAPHELNAQLVHDSSDHVSPVGLVQVDDLQAFDWVQDGLASGALDWMPLKLHGGDEHVNDAGYLEWTGASEGVIRHQYQEWARLMAAGQPAGVR